MNTNTNKLKIVAFQNGTGSYEEMLNETFPINNKYFNRYQYPFFKITKSFLPQNVNNYPACLSWEKTYIFNYLFKEYPNADWFFTLDADSVILDHRIDLAIFPYLAPDYGDFVVCDTGQGIRTRWWNFNAGIYFVRNSIFIKNFWKNIMAFIDQNHGSIIEQALYQWMVRENVDNLSDHIIFYPKTAFNHDGKFIYHACSDGIGLPTDQLIKFRVDLLKKKIASELKE